MPVSRRVKNRIGSFLGYGDCPRCGDNWWWKSHNNRGIMIGPCTFRLLCDECYLKDKERIDQHNADLYAEYEAAGNYGRIVKETQ